MICPKCGTLYDITHAKVTEQTGGNTEKIYNKIINEILNETYKYNNTEISSLLESNIFEKLDEETRNKILDKVRKYFNETKEQENIEITMPKLIFYCKKCGNNELIKNNTILYAKSLKGNLTYELNMNPDIINDNTLLITTNYICPNKDCKSQTDATQREANITYNEGKLVYICRSCKTIWHGHT